MSEATLQATLIQMLRTLYPNLVINLSLNGISLNGLSPAQKAILIRDAKQQGMEPGVPDLLIYLPDGKVLNLELKVAKGKQSTEQVAIQAKLNALGHNYYIIKDVYEPFNLIAEHTSLEYRKFAFFNLDLAIKSNGVTITEPFLHYPIGTPMLSVNQTLIKLYNTTP